MKDKADFNICGRLGHDVEIRATEEGRHFGILSIAVNKIISFDKTTEKLKTKTNWFKALIWNEYILVNNASFLKRGRKVYIKGELGVINNDELKNQIVIEVKNRTGELIVFAKSSEEDQPEEIEEEQGELLPEEVVGKGLS